MLRSLLIIVTRAQGEWGDQTTGPLHGSRAWLQIEQLPQVCLWTITPLDFVDGH